MGVHIRFSVVHNGTLPVVVEVDVPLVGGIRHCCRIIVRFVKEKAELVYSWSRNSPIFGSMVSSQDKCATTGRKPLIVRKFRDHLRQSSVHTRFYAVHNSEVLVIPEVDVAPVGRIRYCLQMFYPLCGARPLASPR